MTDFIAGLAMIVVIGYCVILVVGSFAGWGKRDDE